MTFKNTKTILFAGLIAAMILPFSGMNFAVAEEQTENHQYTKQELVKLYHKTFGMDRDVERQDKIEIMRNILESEPIKIQKSKEQQKFENELISLLEQREKTVGISQLSEIESIIDLLKPQMLEYGLVLIEDLDEDKDYWEKELQKARYDKAGLTLTEEDQLIPKGATIANGPEDWHVIHTVSYLENGFWRSTSTFTEHVDDDEYSHFNFVFPALWDDEVETVHEVINNSYSTFQIGQSQHWASYWTDTGSNVKSCYDSLSYQYDPREFKDWTVCYNNNGGIDEDYLSYSTIRVS